MLPLHSSLTSEEQQTIFQHPPPGIRKVIVATNIAETSITIDDVVYVVDCGKLRQKGYDAASRLETLQTHWTSKAAARQRRGRAGRVRPGVCYHLVPRKMHERCVAGVKALLLPPPCPLPAGSSVECYASWIWHTLQYQYVL